MIQTTYIVPLYTFGVTYYSLTHMSTLTSTKRTLRREPIYLYTLLEYSDSAADFPVMLRHLVFYDNWKWTQGLALTLTY
jgi:hypothetical protein